MIILSIFRSARRRAGDLIKVGTCVCLTGLYATSVMAQSVVEIDTTMGAIQVELYSDEAPRTVANFIKYIEIDYFDGMIFHRVIDDWLIQGGGYYEDLMVRDTFDPIRSEATNGLENLRGTIAMARLYDPHSADSQFFINLDDNHSLDHRARTMNDYGYTVFGRVVEGMDVADAIGDVETHEVDGFEDVPVEPVIIKSIRLLD